MSSTTTCVGRLLRDAGTNVVCGPFDSNNAGSIFANRAVRGDPSCPAALRAAATTTTAMMAPGATQNALFIWSSPLAFRLNSTRSPHALRGAADGGRLATETWTLERLWNR